MEPPAKPEIAFEYHSALRVYKDGRVERLSGTDFVPASDDPVTGVSCKDVTIPGEGDSISARLYLPKLSSRDQKFPLLVYFHGSAFCLCSPFTSMSDNYVKALVAEANVVAVSVNYRKAPEHPIPAAYEDSWAALQWCVSHSRNGTGPESWLNEHADFKRVFLGGESAGANIAHNLAMLAGNPEHGGLCVELLGIALLQPYFWGSDPIGSEASHPKKPALDSLWPFVCPSSPDNDDPRVNPMASGGPSLAGLGCRRVLVCVAENDALKDRGWAYYNTLSSCGWMGVADIMETDGEDHGFHLFHLEADKTKALIKRLAAFFNTTDIPPSAI